jgi:hypothetical protein
MKDTGTELVAEIGGVEVLRYVYRPDTALFEAPKPYFHPLRTTAGDLVSSFRPHDHRWHKGIQMTAPWVSGENFWGGGTFVDALAYDETTGRVHWFDPPQRGAGARRHSAVRAEQRAVQIGGDDAGTQVRGRHAPIVSNLSQRPSGTVVPAAAHAGFRESAWSSDRRGHYPNPPTKAAESENSPAVHIAGTKV